MVTVALVGFTVTTIFLLAAAILGPLEFAPFLVLTIFLLGYTTWVSVSGATAPHVLTIEEKAQILRAAGKDPVLLDQAKSWIKAHPQASGRGIDKELDGLAHLTDEEFVKKTIGTRTKGASPGVGTRAKHTDPAVGGTLGMIDACPGVHCGHPSY